MENILIPPGEKGIVFLYLCVFYFYSKTDFAWKTNCILSLTFPLYCLKYSYDDDNNKNNQIIIIM